MRIADIYKEEKLSADSNWQVDSANMVTIDDDDVHPVPHVE